MKKIISNSLVALLVLGGTTAFAETPKPGSMMPPLERLKEARTEAKSEIKDVREKLASTTKEIKGEIKDNVKDRIENRVENRIGNRYDKMFDRFQATIDRELAIKDKITSRIEKIKANGGNTTEAENSVAEAKTFLDKALTDLETLKGVATSTLSQNNSSTTIKTLRDSLSLLKKASLEVEKDIREAHKKLEKAVGILRGVSQLRNASSTKQN